MSKKINSKSENQKVDDEAISKFLDSFLATQKGLTKNPNDICSFSIKV